MIRIDNAIDRLITKTIIEEDRVRSEEHTASGKLTASSLADPMRFQLLKYLGVPGKVKDEYALRKFARGRDVEDWYISKCKQTEGLVIDTQKEVEYRGVIGLVDAVMDNDLLDFKVGIIPHEIKSVTNLNYKWISKKGEVGLHYKLQAGLYALALGKKHFALDFIASDDYRIHSVLFETQEIASQIDDIITNYNRMIELKTVPEWRVLEAWQDNEKYQKYDSFWVTATEAQFRTQLKTLGIDY